MHCKLYDIKSKLQIEIIAFFANDQNMEEL